MHPDKTCYALPKVMPRGVISAENFKMGTKGNTRLQKKHWVEILVVVLFGPLVVAKCKYV